MFCGHLYKPTARVTHKCSSCGESIDVGSQYFKWASFDDGTAFTNKMHTECYEAHSDDARYWGDSEWTYNLYGHTRGSSE